MWNIAEEVRRYSNDLGWRIRLRRALERLDETLKDMPLAEPGFSVGSVREDREGRRLGPSIHSHG